MTAAAVFGGLVLPIGLVIGLGAGFSAAEEDVAQIGVAVAALPAPARAALPDLRDQLAMRCPELPLVWVLSLVQTESGWNAQAFNPSGAAGLLQFLPATWAQAGGTGPAWSTGARPASTHPVFEARTHLHVGVGWLCDNLDLVSEHLRETGKPSDPLDALAVCHIAGCSRVTGSRTGIPTPGEADCPCQCTNQIKNYLATIKRWVRTFSAPIPAPIGVAGSPTPYSGGATGCVLVDPTGTGGCVTGATAWLLAQVATHVHQGSVSCWDAHAWNPTSDHPRGRACDYTIGRLGRFPGPADTAKGWALAEWLRAYAGPLQVSYVIWQGRIWSVGRDSEGWRPYSGGGIYNTSDPTGGHHDHIHVSLAL